jgi:CRP-like cAMP-binding protein
MISTPELEKELRSIYLLAGLNPVQFDNVMQTSHIINLKEGETLFNRGEDAKQFFLVRRGQIKLFRISPEGHEKVIEIVMPGQTFAEALMFMERPSYPVSATALHASELISFDSASFLDILRHSIDTCFRLMGDMSIWLHSRLNEIEALSVQNATLRLCNYLLRGAAADAQGSMDVELDIPKYVLASRLSVTPESLSRILQSMQQSGVITVEGHTIHIHDLENMRSYGIGNSPGKG